MNILARSIFVHWSHWVLWVMVFRKNICNIKDIFASVDVFHCCSVAGRSFQKDPEEAHLQNCPHYYDLRCFRFRGCYGVQVIPDKHKTSRRTECTPIDIAISTQDMPRKKRPPISKRLQKEPSQNKKNYFQKKGHQHLNLKWFYDQLYNIWQIQIHWTL